MEKNVIIIHYFVTNPFFMYASLVRGTMTDIVCPGYGGESDLINPRVLVI